MATKYAVIEMHNGNAEERTFTYDTRANAEVKMYQILSEAVVSDIATHTVMLMTDEGFVLECKCYKHETEGE